MTAISRKSPGAMWRLRVSPVDNGQITRRLHPQLFLASWDLSTIVEQMVMLAAAATNSDPTMDENFSRLFDSFFGIFEDLSGIGAQWGWLFPTFVGIAVALAFVGGFRYMFEKAQEKVKPVFLFALLIVGLLAFVAIRQVDNQNTATQDQLPGDG